MHCLDCGAALADRTAPCLFCGETLSPLKTSLERRWVMLILSLVVITLCLQSLRCISYSPQVELRRGSCAHAVGPLMEGQTKQVRSLLATAYYRIPHSGLPAAMIGASHYRDYMVHGATSDLSRARSYIKSALRKEKNFITHYYQAVMHYEDSEYDQVQAQLTLAIDDLKGGFNPWGKVINRRRWFEDFAVLGEAAAEAKKTGVKPRPYYPRLDAPPEGPHVKVEFAL